MKLHIYSYVKNTGVFLALLGLIATTTLSLSSHASAINVFKNPDAAQSDAADVVSNSSNSSTSLDTVVNRVVSILFIIIGIISVLMIIVGGIRYATSNGDQSAIKSAKNTILYAVVGLVVALLAFAIVNFVVARIK